MKKRVFLILFMFLTTLVLAGCDWFGQKITTTTSGSETTVSVTTSVTTNAPTTTVTTTVPVTTVTTVTTNPSNIGAVMK
jgi:predicted component of type VI protein secretion system